MAVTVRLPRSLWRDPEWSELSMGAQLLAMTCLAFGKSGPCSTERIARKTGWDERFIETARAEVEGSPFAHMVIGANRRRRLPAPLVTAVKERDGWKCVYCGATEALEIDHIHPVSRGGSDDMDNLQALCQRCTRSKGAKLIENQIHET